MFRLVKAALDYVVRFGRLEVIDAAGALHRFGDNTGELVRIRLTHPSAYKAFVFNPELRIGEAYMDGTLVMEVGSLYDFLALVMSNMQQAGPTTLARLQGALEYATRRLRQMNTFTKARENVAHHYDLDGRLYELFLDEDWQYSCAYFSSPETSLEEAQLDKKRRLAAKLALDHGNSVLDIGSGWGGLGLYLAEIAQGEVTGVTLSEEQHRVSRRRAEEHGAADHVDFRLQDYRKLTETFDRIVSVGMFEHVGTNHYREYFAKCFDLLADDGVFVLHSIGRFDGPSYTNAWIRKYIFPGGYIPALSEVIPVIERSGFKVSDVEILRLHYAETLKEWRRRFMQQWDKAAKIYDERFCRMWEFYLAGSECAFRYQDLMVFQIQLVKDQTVLPLTRRYMEQRVDELRARENQRLPVNLAGE
ncbi:SAM-dependent methyltransferase [Rhodobium gokarnense]|uniref:Cyclopropane-fatty-acyl-phospholipid synthase n=1 Tax=Rhodobium gokarnense TaxID=364296 RepID=A0ABT3HFG6_9HYPH|nr:cyclopropane-fatty-acyl-phospholipid synthase family protein [Rhodobium gokarnense]MCW2309152.1 cyclopropane-fatty-acyl-phospholipid synthase [Rhodobium gokarnense]